MKGHLCNSVMILREEITIKLTDNGSDHVIFIEDFSLFIEAATLSHEKIILGDVNVHINSQIHRPTN